MTNPHSHPKLINLSRDQKEELWFQYKDQHPNYLWSFSFFALWLLWTLSWMSLASYLDALVTDLWGSLVIQFVLSLLIGVIGGVIFIARFMQPQRIRQFHRYLDDRTLDEVYADLQN